MKTKNENKLKEKIFFFLIIFSKFTFFVVFTSFVFPLKIPNLLLLYFSHTYKFSILFKNNKKKKTKRIFSQKWKYKRLVDLSQQCNVNKKRSGVSKSFQPLKLFSSLKFFYNLMKIFCLKHLMGMRKNNNRNKN